jgi:hypothetical protein
MLSQRQWAIYDGLREQGWTEVRAWRKARVS